MANCLYYKSNPIGVVQSNADDVLYGGGLSVKDKIDEIDTNLNKLYDIEDDGELSDLNIDRVAGRVSMGTYNSSTLNIPVAGSGFVETFINKDSSNYGKQIAYSNNELYYRNLNSGTWASWYTFLNNSTSLPNLFNTSVARGVGANCNTVDLKINYWSNYITYIGLLFTRYSVRIIQVSVDGYSHATFTSTVLHGSSETITGTADDTNNLVTLKSNMQWNAFGILMFSTVSTLNNSIVLQNARLT